MRPPDDYASVRALARAMFRAGRIEAVRESVRAGTYETPERLYVAVDRMIDELMNDDERTDRD